MEKPYHGLAWHDPKIKKRAAVRDTSDQVCAETQPTYERTYPDGSLPTECWAFPRAFATDNAFTGGDDPWNET